MVIFNFSAKSFNTSFIEQEGKSITFPQIITTLSDHPPNCELSFFLFFFFFGGQYRNTLTILRFFESQFSTTYNSKLHRPSPSPKTLNFSSLSTIIYLSLLTVLFILTPYLYYLFYCSSITILFKSIK